MNDPMTLEQYISQYPLRETELVRMGEQIAEALAAIHQQGKVHGDVKPGNVLVTAEGGYQLIGMDPVRRYPDGEVPSFVAPELAAGAGYHPRIDVYALGMMLKSLTPKQGVNTVLSDILDRACAPNPDRRYQSALELANDLDALQQAMEDGNITAEAASYAQSGDTELLSQAMREPQFTEIQPGDPYRGQPYADQQPSGPYRGQIYVEQPYAGQQSMGQQPGGAYTGQSYTGQPADARYVGQQYMKQQPGRAYAGQQPDVRYAGQQYTGTQSVDQMRLEQPTPKKKKQKATPEDEKASMVLRFVFPILIVLLFAVLAAAYFVLIRPALREDDSDPTTTEATTEKTTDETTEETTEAQEIAVPDLVGKEESAAKEELEKLNLTAVIEYVTSDTVAEGLVVEQTVTADSTVAPQTEVGLKVSEGTGCPYEYQQKVTVSAAPGSTSGTLTLYNWENGDWAEKFSCSCVVGKNGIGSDYGEGKGITPMGTFKLGFVLGTSDPNNGMTFKQASSTIGIVDDVNSSLYNTLVDSTQVGDVSVDPVGNNIVSGKLSCVIFIEHNGNGLTSDNVVAGKGSVITICGNNNSISETAGCIDISSSNMATLLQNLDGTKNPYIEITLD